MKKCPSCGYSNQDYSKFCISCGATLPAQTDDARPSPSSYAPPPPEPKPSPYASMPHIPESAKRKTPSKKSGALGGFALIAGLIGVVVLSIWLAQPTAPQHGSPVPRPQHSQKAAVDSDVSFALSDSRITDGWESGQYLLKGTIRINSSTQYSKATVTISVYDGATLLTSGTETFGIHNNKIEFVLPVYLTTYEANSANRLMARVIDLY